MCHNPLRSLLSCAALCALAACTPKLATYSYPTPVDTGTREVTLLDTDRFDTSTGVYALANYPGARLAGFSESGQDTFTALIPSENSPINTSPWYSFGVADSTKREITIALTFPAGTGNRYLPKVAKSLRGSWEYLPFDKVDTVANVAYVRLDVAPSITYLSAQEVIATDSIMQWINTLQSSVVPTVQTIGRSKLGRPIWGIELGQGRTDDRPAVVFLSRQHPPEITGFIAFQSFFERLLEIEPTANAFRENYRILAVPVVNPDGVDEGHWRHNAGGIDLNRDWATYQQPEVRAVQDWLQRSTKSDQVLWGMDFHSTQYDVLYTHDPRRVDYRNPEILAKWVEALRTWTAENYAGASDKPKFSPLGRPLITGQDTLRVEPDAIGKPTSASWFVKHYQAIGVTYEVGDEQDRDFIRAKARKAAELLMEQLNSIDKQQ